MKRKAPHLLRGITLLVLGFFFLSSFNLQAPQSVAANSACADNGFTSGSLTVMPSHGRTFYIDTGVSPRVDASYVGYRITSTSTFNGWVSLSGFTGGVVSLANADDQYRQLPEIAANQTVTAYFLLKAGASTRVAQTHTLKIFPTRPDAAGASASLTCDFTFNRVAETIKAAANKVTEISVGGDGTPELGELITVTATGATGTIGAGSVDTGRILWFSPAAFSTFPTGALRLESVTLVVSDNNQIAGNGNNELRYYKERLLVTPNIFPDSEASTNDEDTTKDTLVGKRYYRNIYKFRVIGKTTSNVGMQPIAQISSGTQIKHTDLSSIPSTTSTQINTSVTTTNASVTKTVVSTENLTTSGGFIEVPYRITIDNLASAGSIIIDEVIDSPSPGVEYKSGSATVTGTTWSGNPIQLDSDPSPKPWHFVGPFTVAHNTNVVINYTMKIPTGTNTSYANSAVAYIGQQQIGSGVTTYTSVSVSISGGGVSQVTTSSLSFTPEVVTLPATSVTTSGATLNGTVDPNDGSNGVATGFHISTSPTLNSYETLTVTASLTGTSAVAQSKVYSAGTQGTTYYYRIYATAGGVNYLGDILNFTTLENPSTPTVSTVAASSITATTAVLNGSIDPNLRTVTQVRFEYGTSTSLTTPTPTTTILYELDENGVVPANNPVAVTLSGSSPTDVSLDVSSLTNNTTYYFRVSITYTDGNNTSQTLNGSILNFTAFNRGTTAQTINFNEITNKEFGGSTFSAGATATSGLTVSYTTETPQVCSVASDGTITILAAGTCSITASQLGNATYAAATDVTRQFEVTPKALTITADSKTINYGQNTPAFTFTVGSGQLVGNDTVASTTPNFASTDAYGYGPSGTAPTLAGTYSITLSGAQFGVGSASNYTISYVAGTYTINKISQATFTLNSSSVSLNSTFNLTTEGGSGDGAVTYAVANDGGTGCTVSAAVLTTAGSTGTCQITATKAADRNYLIATNTQNFVINSLQAQTINYPGLPNQVWSNSTLTDTATATSGLTVQLTSHTQSVCTVSGFTVTMLRIGTCTLHANQPGDGSYNPASEVTRSFEISGASRTIVLKSKNDGASYSNSYDPSGYANWGLTPPVLKSLADFDDSDTKTYSLGTGSTGCSVNSNGNVTFTGAGTCVVKVTIAEGLRYLAATSSNASFIIGKKDQTITFASLNNMVVGDPDQNLSASTDAPGLTVLFTADPSSSAFCEIVAGKIKAKAAGSCRVNADEPGNTNYNPAAQVFKTFTITASSGGGGSPAPVAPAPSPGPRIDSISKPQICAIGNDIIITGNYFDNGKVTFDGTSISVKTLSSTSISLSLPKADVGERTIRVTTPNGSASITISYVDVPKPKFVQTLIPYMSQGEYLSLPIVATNATSYSLIGTLPEGLVFDSSNGTISGTPKENGIFGFVITARGICGETSQVLELDIDKETPNAISHRINILPGATCISVSSKDSFEAFLERAKSLAPRNLIPEIYMSGGGIGSGSDLGDDRRDCLCDLFLDEEFYGKILEGEFIGSANRIEIIVYWARP